MKSSLKAVRFAPWVLAALGGGITASAFADESPCIHPNRIGKGNSGIPEALREMRNCQKDHGIFLIRVPDRETKPRYTCLEHFPSALELPSWVQTEVSSGASIADSHKVTIYNFTDSRLRVVRADAKVAQAIAKDDAASASICDDRDNPALTVPKRNLNGRSCQNVGFEKGKATSLLTGELAEKCIQSAQKRAASRSESPLHTNVREKNLREGSARLKGSVGGPSHEAKKPE